MLDEIKKLPYPFSKRSFDLVLGLILFVFCIPLYIVIAVLIKCFGIFIKEDRGPVFYVEKRISHGEVFNLIKFRVIKKRILKSLIRKNGKINKIKELERNRKNSTRIGHYLKKWYLDEVPQLWNILKGDMSFVGPRPWPLEDYQMEIDQGIHRKTVIKAGLTGLVQVNKGNYEGLEEERELDYRYIDRIKNHSQLSNLFYDIWLLLCSFKPFFRAEGL